MTFINVELSVGGKMIVCCGKYVSPGKLFFFSQNKLLPDSVTAELEASLVKMKVKIMTTTIVQHPCMLSCMRQTN